ncbi:VOC family protein [Allobranchiibius sp. GilTou73]|uniref:VOC family protein n=1 Tax=Allobranchiibius sp. GilTou73 TaxID=2904523 RepID=UPI001F3A2FA0|nr:hypothetical protein [Allobranchiibius sp. GilTou73]UIJ34248.1 hypothetical protein LVQ62_14160 [Allobranchiibius sp. GilTou73]
MRTRRHGDHSYQQQAGRAMQDVGPSCRQAVRRERVLGIGGYFLRAADPAALGAWYREALGPDAMLAQLREHGADVTDEVREVEGAGRFGWVTDLAGHRIELWQLA